jgi:hypothetical protein
MESTRHTRHLALDTLQCQLAFAKKEQSHYYRDVSPLGLRPQGARPPSGGLRCVYSLMRVNVYIDGFNLYYGCLQSSPHKWLDLDAFCHRVLPNDEINQIRYFTARITDRPGELPAPAGVYGQLNKRQRQQMYLRALGTLANVSIHYGRYLAKTKRRPLVKPIPSFPRTVEVHDSEEKGSDVNLATYLLLDAFDQACETAVVISNDSDLVLPIAIVRSRFCPVGVLNPHKHPTNEMKTTASFHRQIHRNDLAACQFPPTLTDQHGTIHKPTTW